MVLCHAALGLPPGVVPAQRLARTRPAALGAVSPWHHTTPVGTRTRAGRSGRAGRLRTIAPGPLAPGRRGIGVEAATGPR